jgi:hypothetical protein
MHCPGCSKPLGALTATPHCTAQECTWTKCTCGVTYDRVTGNAFGPKTFYPASA